MTISDSVFDAKHIRCVPVIAVFSTSGVIKPLYVTVNWTKLKIENYTVQDNAFGDNWIYFLCDVMDGDKKKQIKLQFPNMHGSWTLNTSVHKVMPHIFRHNHNHV